MGALIDETGNEYGRLTVIERAPTNGNWGGAHWLCVCKCGKQTVVRGDSLRTGNTHSCGCLQAKDEIGNEYGRLTVIGRAQSQDGYARWICECECGEQIVVRGANLRSNNSKSCGCLRADKASIAATQLCESNKLPEGEAALNQLFNYYKKNSAQRDREFALSIDDFRVITSHPCIYCGSPPSQEIRSNDSVYIYNGIDRKDTKLGYIPGNVLPCCKQCNYAKRDMPYEEFIDYLDQLVAFRSENE